MIDNKTITAVMFVYNEENYIDESLSAVLNQTVQIDQIIVVDDFSTDATRDIVQQCVEVRLVESRKRGMAYACETGLKLVDTELFFLCHGDDVLCKNYVAEMYKFICEQEISYAYSNFITTDSGLTPKRFINKNDYYDKYELLDDCFTGGYLFGYSEIIPYFMPFPNGLGFEDWYISIELSQQFGGNHVNNRPLFKYRRHPDSDSMNFQNNREKYLKLLHRNMDFLTLVRSIVSDGLSARIIESRLQFYDAMINHSLSKTVSVLASDLFTWREKLSVSLFPLTLRLKYR